jgi:2-polyprenyl-6-hydroxyphenyl methylase/3-demethylubiquinone-9 3-methyltransferase
MRGRTDTAVLDHEAEVAARFEALHFRFKSAVRRDDVRLRALEATLGPLDGRSLLDLGCGKGRFAVRLKERGAKVVGLDRAEGMLAAAHGIGRVLGSAARLPFADGAFDGVFAVEVFEHLPAEAVPTVLGEARRVLKPGGTIAIVDKNAASLNARRPWLPSLLVKWIDERRGRWMYPAGCPVRERWFWPWTLKRALGRRFDVPRVDYLISPDERRSYVFRRAPAARLMAVWTARAPGGGES